VILIIGILAAIALPSFLSQKNKATAAQAEEMARSMATAMETYATNHEGSYAGGTLAELHNIETTIPSPGVATKTHPLESTVTGNTYTVTAVAEPTGAEFKVERSANGESTYTCTPALNTNGCPTGGQW
jgi:type IV pilus assembly protein PilA